MVAPFISPPFSLAVHVHQTKVYSLLLSEKSDMNNRIRSSSEAETKGFFGWDGGEGSCTERREPGLVLPCASEQRRPDALVAPKPKARDETVCPCLSCSKKERCSLRGRGKARQECSACLFPSRTRGGIPLGCPFVFLLSGRHARFW
jgi:hypothetical protein